MSKFECSVFDQCEGNISVIVNAMDVDEAEELATDAAWEHGCRHVYEVEAIEVCVH
jgi:hypothetical protein